MGWNQAGVARSVFRISSFVLLGVVGLLFADALLHVSPANWSDAIHNYGFMAVSACSSIVVFGRVAFVRHNRRGWLLFALGLGLLSAGDFYYTTMVVPQADPPFPTFADILYLAGYPVLTLGLAVLLAGRLNRPAPSMWLDAGISVSAVLMISVGLLLGAMTVTTGTTLQVFVALAYPLADFVLIAMIAAVVALTGARLDRVLVAAVLAILSISIADVVFFYGTTVGTWSDANPIGLLWPLGGALFALAAWSRDPRTKVVPLTGMRALVLPSAFAVSIIGYELVGDPPKLAQIIGSVGLVLLVVRMFVGVRENAGLVDRLRLDPLTGLGNRGSLSADLSRAIAFGRTQTLVLADLDGFKLYNDAYGHPAGDAMLRRLSGALADAVGPMHAYRIGGDEFCVLLDGDLAATEEARSKVADALSEHGKGFSVGVSLGAAQLPDESANPEEAVQIADQRMYASKDTRRDDRRSKDALAVLINAQRARQPDLGDHVDGVAELAEQVGEVMGLLPGEVTMLSRAAELHDIGKIAIPDTILQKPGPLNDEEWEFMRQHTVLGERILRSADSLAPVARIVRSTHERYDGQGYPDNLSGEEIPLASRIILACDAYSAMTSRRPYAAPMSRAESIDELRRCAGTHFDPQVVNVLCGCLEDEPEPGYAASPAASPVTRPSVLIPSI